ncbi:hypothetical protein Fifi44_00035 [Erwinia phage Fifi44]|uniref:Uncharacterized protein n=1 Tax=Erwinia phage Fifi44 TaxID=2876597 RepID=A0AAE8Y350_9CAUD|nr:hypothetical protein QNG95_gp35 [Erwinia phage Fifi44]UCR74904.1 hypothetical protein Fifi44_00035 [Erwinia phage Fifi44]UCR80863.1 hypothetical protein Fifi451_00043 [Erwinia phage Fifi451]
MNLIAMVAKFKGWIATAFVFLVGLGVAYLSGKQKAEQTAEVEKKDAEIESTKAVADTQVREATAAKKVVESVNRSSDTSVDDELQRFTRD